MSRARTLNANCDCASTGAPAHANFYANVPVFVDASHVQRMQSLISVVHSVVALPGFREEVLGSAPAIARLEAKTLGVFTGFDFHIGVEGPKLIEINTNAGGAMLLAAAEWRHPDCCIRPASTAGVPPSRGEIEAGVVRMFRNEWRLARGQRGLKTIAIVDDDPARQFLFPEFGLFADLFARHGIEAFIADARELEFDGVALSHHGRKIDLAYNRLTDFHFEHPSHVAIRRAYEADAAVITPHPRAHALFADKRNLVRLTDEHFLRSVGAASADIQCLIEAIPRTQFVGAGDDSWWTRRGDWFFKPAAGFGSRGAYRGDKLTRRVFGELIKGGYVAQRYAPPGERLRGPGEEMFKVDVRSYTYDGLMQLLAARLYQGQTTNFRTRGGGFAPVIELTEAR